MSFSYFIQFENEQFKKLRSVIIDGEPWFFVVDVIKLLGFKDDAYRMVLYTSDDDVRKYKIQTSSGEQEMKLISSHGMNWLLVNSTSSKIKELGVWFESTVFPTLYKFAYSSTSSGTAWAKALTSERKHEAEYEALKIEYEEMKAQYEKLQIECKKSKEKAKLYDEYISSDLLLGLRDTANQLNLSERGFIDWLANNDYIRRSGYATWQPTKKATSKGYMKIVPFSNGSNGFRGYKTMITSKGAMYFLGKMKRSEARKEAAKRKGEE